MQQKDPIWEVRAATIRTMGLLRSPMYLSAIVLALDDFDDSVVMDAITAYRMISGNEAAPRLALIASNNNIPDHIRYQAILELEELAETKQTNEE